MKWLWRAFKFILPYKKVFALFIAATIGLGLFGSVPFVLGKGIVELLTGETPRDALGAHVNVFVKQCFGPGKEYLFGLGLLFLASWLLRAFFVFIASYLSSWLAQRLRMEAMTRIMKKLLVLDQAFFDQSEIGDLVSRMVADGNALRVSVKIFLDFVQQPPTLLGLAAYAFYLDPVLFLVGGVGVPLVFGPLAALTKKIYKHGRRYQKQTAELTEIMLQNLSGIKVVHAYGAEQAEGEAFNKSALRLFKTGMRRNLARALQRPMAEVVMGVGMSAVLLYGGARVMDGELQAAAFMTFLGAAFAMYGPLRGMIGALGQLAEMVPAAERTFEILDLEPEIKDAPDAVECPPLEKALVFENVSFDYGRGAVLKDFNLTVRRGETVGIVGRTGVGKSTLLALLLRFYDPTAGRLTIDGTDLRRVTLSSLRARTALVSQEPFLFNAGVADNIRYGKPEASDAEIIQAAQRAAIHDEIAALPEGYETSVGERGGLFSGGQRQRLAVARAILREAPLLLLDEPTSALDAESERLIQNALEGPMRERTCLIVAHRLCTLRRADKIVVFNDDGGVECIAAHEELLQKSPAYAALWREQQGDETAEKPVAAPASTARKTDRPK